MAEPTPHPQATRQLTAAEKQRADGIKGSYIKQGREAERQDWCKALGVASPEEATEIAHLRTRPTQSELGHAKHASRGFAMLTGAIIGAALAVAGVAVHDMWLTSQFASFGHEMAITGAVTQQLNPPQRCVPGEHLADGRVCPQANPQ